MMTITKTQQAVDLWKSGDHLSALKIFRTFKAGVSKAERDSLHIAVEMSGDHKEFYESLGHDLETVMTEATKVVKEKFIR